MSIDKKNILLFTASFPFGNGEQFLETEIKYAAFAFKKVYILPQDLSGVARPIPDNVEVISKVSRFKPIVRLSLYVIKNLITITRVYGFSFLKTKNKKKYLKGFKDRVFRLAFEIEQASCYKRELTSHLNSIDCLYFYWFDEPILHFLILKLNNQLKQRIICRTHGFDFDERQGRFPIYREFELSQIDAVYPVSHYGNNYLNRHYSDIYFTSRVFQLGTLSYGENPLDINRKKSKYYHIVSCSSFHKVKRVHKIIEVLRYCKVKIIWTHFGSGELEKEIKELSKSLPSNISAVFKGHMKNSEILDFYKTESIDLFINTSELEGIPVSIMEAISFGIPSIGCDTCGVPEIITQQTGFLFPVNFRPEKMAEKIEEYFDKSEEEILDFRKRVRQFWKDNFNADVNYPSFINECF